MGKFKIISLVAVLVLVILTPFFNSLEYKLLGLLLIYFFGVVFFRFELLYPYVWLTPFILLYNTSIVILDSLGFRESVYSDTIIQCTFLSEITLFFFCLLFIKQRNRRILHDSFFSPSSLIVLKRIVIALGVVLLMYLPLFFRSGFSSKAEVNLNGGLPGLEFFSVLFKFFYLLYLTCVSHYNKVFPIKDVLYAFLVSASISVFIGERDIMLTTVLFSFFVYYFFFNPTKKQIAIIVILGILLVPISSQFKQVTTSETDAFSEFSLLESLLGGEFFSSGRNIETLLDNNSSWSFQYGAAIPNDILRSIFPSRFVPVDNSTGWFNHMFNTREDLGYGIGFSFLGEGYLQGGLFGVVVWTIILAMILRVLYNNSSKTIWGFAIYIYMISFIIYSMRGDLSYVLSPLIKHVIIVFVMCTLLLPQKRINKSSSKEVCY